MARTTNTGESHAELLPSKYSPSRLKDFMQCPRLFYYKTILGISTPPTEATARGTAAHHVFERIFDHPRGERTLETALSYVAPAWAMMLNPVVDRPTVSEATPEWRLREENNGFYDQHPDESSYERLFTQALEYAALVPPGSDTEASFLDSIEDCVRGWFAMENPEKFDPHERELHVLAKAAGTTVHGFIDRLDRVTTTAGEVRWYVSDYKTGKPPKPQYQDEAFFQLAVYALLVEEQLKVRVHQLRLIYVKEGRPDAVLTRRVDDALLKKTLEKIRSAVRGIKTCAQRGEWLPRKQVLCGWCHFKDVCPAFNPHLEGLLPEEVALRLSGAPGAD